MPGFHFEHVILKYLINQKGGGPGPTPKSALELFRFSHQRIFLALKYINNLRFNNWLWINLGLRVGLFSQNNGSKRHLLVSQVCMVTYNPCWVTSMSFLKVSVFSGRQLGKYSPKQVARTKILVAMTSKVVAAWRVARTKKLDIVPLALCWVDKNFGPLG